MSKLQKILLMGLSLIGIVLHFLGYKNAIILVLACVFFALYKIDKRIN